MAVNERGGKEGVDGSGRNASVGEGPRGTCLEGTRMRDKSMGAKWMVRDGEWAHQ